MRITGDICEFCGRPMIDIAGFDQKEPRLICNNGKCSSNFAHIMCPECHSGDKDIKVIGLGHQMFKCKQCGREWNSFDD